MAILVKSVRIWLSTLDPPDFVALIGCISIVSWPIFNFKISIGSTWSALSFEIKRTCLQQIFESLWTPEVKSCEISKTRFFTKIGHFGTKSGGWLTGHLLFRKFQPCLPMIGYLYLKISAGHLLKFASTFVKLTISAKFQYFISRQLSHLERCFERHFVRLVRLYKFPVDLNTLSWISLQVLALVRLYDKRLLKRNKFFLRC